MNTGSSTEDSWTAAVHFGKHTPSFFLAQLAPGSALHPDWASPCPEAPPCSSPILEPPLHLHSYWGRAEPWPRHHGVNLKLVCSRASRRRAAAPRGSWLCACHSLTGCQAAGSECPRRGGDKRQTIVPSFPPWLQGSRLFLLENGNQAPYLIPGTGSWSPRKGSCFVEGLPVK